MMLPRPLRAPVWLVSRGSSRDRTLTRCPDLRPDYLSRDQSTRRKYSSAG